MSGSCRLGTGVDAAEMVREARPDLEGFTDRKAADAWAPAGLGKKAKGEVASGCPGGHGQGPPGWLRVGVQERLLVAATSKQKEAGAG